MSRKTIAKSLADGVVQFAILGVYRRRLNNDSATVNIPVFYWTKKHFISEGYFVCCCSEWWLVCCCFFFLNVREATWFPSKIKPWVVFGLPYLLIELFYIGMPVVRMDGRCTVTWLPDILGWVDYHISLTMGLRPRAARSAARGDPLLESRSSSRGGGGGVGCAPPAPSPWIRPWCSSDVPLPSSSWLPKLLSSTNH